MSNQNNPYQEAARDYIAWKLSPLPVEAETKRPSLPDCPEFPEARWKPLQEERLDLSLLPKAFSSPKTGGVGIVTGKISGNLEALDVDLKYDDTGTLWEELQAIIEDELPGLLQKLTIVRTRSEGKHLLYKCSEIEGNLKLASRPTTAEKRKDPKDSQRVLLETRGEGGYIVAWPTPGYTLEQGTYETIPTITPKDRQALLSMARSFDRLPQPVQESPQERTAKRAGYPSSEGLTPWEDYNSRGDVLGLLEMHGWNILRDQSRGSRVHVRRPGKTEAFRYQSGNFHTELRTFTVFSTSTDFTPERAYSPFQVYALLECREDYRVAARRLREEGYGDPLPEGRAYPPTKMMTSVTSVTSVNRITSVAESLAQQGEPLKIEDVSSSQGSEIVITSPGPEAYEEVLQAIAVASPSGKRVYVVEPSEGEPLELRSYSYQLSGIVRKYDGADSSDRNRDALLQDVVALAADLLPIDRDLLLKEFVELTQDLLGISYESIATETDRLASSRARDQQQAELSKVLSEASGHNEKGDPGKALTLLQDSLRKTSIITARELVPPPQTFQAYLEGIAQIPASKKTGYKALDKFVGFPPGAISLIAGRPSHGKTTLMYNLLLEMSEAYPTERFYFFTYEEPGANIVVKILNRLVGVSQKDRFVHYPELTKPTNYEYLKAYIRRGATDNLQIEQAKERLRDLLDSQRIAVIDKSYSVEDLGKVLAHLVQEGPVGAVFIDYIQRMRTERKTQDKRTEIAHISDQVLQTAKQTGLPIILGAQLNRDAASSAKGSDAKEGKEPRLEHLKEAGNLEEDANTVLSVYNESREQGQDNLPQEVELKIRALKNREGEANQKASLFMDRHTGKISPEPNPDPRISVMRAN